MRKLFVFAAALGLAGCSITEPVAVIGPKGQIYKGSATASMSGGSFKATDGKVTCAGTYDDMTMSQTISFPVICSNGMKGLGTAIRDASGVSGSGTIRMSDGSDWKFVFGTAAEAF